MPRRFLAILIAFALLAPGFVVDARADAASDEAAARAVFQRNLDAIAGRDVDAYLSCYRQDERLVRNGFGGVNLGFAELKAGTDGTNFPDEFEAHDMEVYSVAPGLVYGQYRYRVRFGDQVQEGVSERVFLKGEDGWHIVVTTAFESMPFTPVEAAKDTE